MQYVVVSDAQPEDLRIDVRTAGRLLSEFENTLFVRVLEPDGTPWRGPVKVLLVDGEFMELRGQAEDPPTLVQTQTDRLGLVSLTGALHSEVLRVEVHVLPSVPTKTDEEAPTADPAAPPSADSSSPREPEPETPEAPASPRAKRRVRLVSFAGGVRVQASPEITEPAAALQVHARGLSARRPVFVDLYGSDGAWVYTLHPPFEAGALPRDIVGPTLAPGIVQLEGYQFTTDPGQSTDVVRIQLASQAAPTDAASLDPLLAAHREAVDAPRVDQTYSAKVERKWLSWVDAAELTPTEVEHARAFLLGTLPLIVHDPPLALATRDRDLEAMAARQRRWTLGLRVFMLGGGGLFLLAMTLAMMRAHASAAAATAAELQRSTEEGDEDLDEVMLAVDRAKRAALARAFGVIAIMAAGLVLATIMLESFLWVF